MAMSCKFTAVLVTLCLLLVGAYAKDMPPVVKILEIGAEYVVFDVSGDNSVDGLPVKSIRVNYTRISFSADSSQIHHSEVNSLVALGKSRASRQASQALEVGFDRVVNITNLNAGVTYRFQFDVVNTKDEHGPIQELEVLLKPETPDFSITHQGKWF